MANRPLSFLDPYLPNKQNLEHQRSLLSLNLRTNLLLKIIALLSSLFLYVYVQAERNPTIQRSFNVMVTAMNVPDGMDYDIDVVSLSVTVTGARAILDSLKEADIRAKADMHDLKPDVSEAQLVRLKVVFPSLSDRTVALLQVDPPAPIAHIKIYPPVLKRFPINLSYPQKPPAGYRYANPDLQPSTVKVSGREERVNRVARLVVNATPLGTGAKIDGEFPILPRDKEDRPIDGLTLEPNAVRVVVPLVEEPPSKILLVSPTITELPTPPFSLSDIRVEPSQVKVIGRPGRLINMGTIRTEALSLREMIQSGMIEVKLDVAPDIAVRDLEDRPVTVVKVYITLRKSVASEHPKPGDGSTVSKPMGG